MLRRWCLLVVLVQVACGHRPGEEFTYLSMFLKPSHAGGFSQQEQASLSTRYYQDHGKWYEGEGRQRVRKLLREEEVVRAVGEEGVEGREKVAPIVTPIPRPTSRGEREGWGEGEEEGEGEGGDEVKGEGVRDKAMEVVEIVDKGKDKDEDEEVEVEVEVEVEAEVKKKKMTKKKNKEREKIKKDKEEQGVAEGDDVRVRVVGEATPVSAEEEREEGVSGEAAGEERGEDVGRLSMMVEKLILQYRVHSIADVPCRAHTHWMPQVVHAVREKQPKFRWVCVDTSRAVLKAIREQVGEEVRGEYVLRRFWKQALPRVDMVLSWGGLDNMREENVKRYVRRLGQGRAMVLLGSHAGAGGNGKFAGGGKPINFRRRPYLLRKPMRIVGEVSQGGNDKQLYVYRAKEMFRKDGKGLNGRV